MGNAPNKSKYRPSSPADMNSLSSEAQEDEDPTHVDVGLNSNANQDLAESPEEKSRQLLYLAELVTAIQDRDVSQVREILSRGVNLRTTYEERYFDPIPLICAAQNGEISICKLLLERGADVNQADMEMGATPLIKASENGYIDIVRVLLDNQADIDYCVQQEAIPLGIRWELDDERDPLKVNDIIEPFEGNNSLMKSCREHHVDVVKELLKRGCAINNHNAMGNTALHISCLSRTCNAYASSTSCFVPARLFLGGNAEIVRLLVRNGASLNTENSNNETPLLRALNGPHAMMDWELGETEMLEILDNYNKIIRLLLQAGADVGVTNADGQSVLYKLLEITTFLETLDQGMDHDFTLQLCDLLTDTVSLGCQFTAKDGIWLARYKDFFEKQTAGVCNGILEWLRNAVNSPISLKHSSRNVIRKLLHEPISCSVKKLKIPNLTKDYIILKSH